MDRVHPYGPGGLLYPSEKAFLECAAKGIIWSPDGKCEDFQKSEWLDKSAGNLDELKKFIIRPEVIRCLITGTPWSEWHQPWPLHARGVLIANAYISGDLQLDGCSLLGQLWLVHCEIAGFVNLQDAHTKTLGFSGTHIGIQEIHGQIGKKRSLNARRADIDGDVFLRCIPQKEIYSKFDPGRFRAGAVVSFTKAKIKGSLHCEGGVFSAHSEAFEDKKNLAEGNSGSHAPGDTNSFVAMDCSAAEIHGNVLLSKCFEARGGVDFSYAKIDGGLRCTKGCFQSLYEINRPEKKIDLSDHTEYVALNCRYAKIGGNVSLMCGYQADGSSDFMHTKISGSFYCNGGIMKCCADVHDLQHIQDYKSMGDLMYPYFDALNLYGAKIESGLYLTKILHVRGTISLQKAEVHGLHDDATSWLQNSDICFILSGFNYHYALWKANPRPCISCQENIPCKFKYSGGGNPVPEGGVRLAEHIHKWLQNQPRVRKVRTFLDCCLGETVAGFLRRIPYVFHGRLNEAALGTQTYLDDPAQLKSYGKLEHDANTRSWVQAARVLRIMGNIKAARHLNFLREKYQTDLIRSVLWRSLRRMLLEYPVGYGFKPLRALLATLFVTAYCGFFFSMAGNHGYMVPRRGDVLVHIDVNATNGDEYKNNQKQSERKSLPAGYTRFNAVLYSLDSLLPIIELGQTAAWEPAAEPCKTCYFQNQPSPDWWNRLKGQAYRGNTELTDGFGKRLFEFGGLRILHWLEIIFGWWLVTVGITNFSRIIGTED